jgi:hypothetical protein
MKTTKTTGSKKKATSKKAAQKYEQKKQAEARKIIDIVREKKREIMRSGRTGKAGQANQDKAIEAIFGGSKSKAWKEYMKQYADTPAQLKRLMGADPLANDPDVREARAYLVANAVCGAGTFGRLDLEVDAIDKGL